MTVLVQLDDHYGQEHRVRHAQFEDVTTCIIRPGQPIFCGMDSGAGGSYNSTLCRCRDFSRSKVQFNYAYLCGFQGGAVDLQILAPFGRY